MMSTLCFNKSCLSFLQTTVFYLKIKSGAPLGSPFKYVEVFNVNTSRCLLVMIKRSRSRWLPCGTPEVLVMLIFEIQQNVFFNLCFVQIIICEVHLLCSSESLMYVCIVEQKC